MLSTPNHHVLPTDATAKCTISLKGIAALENETDAGIDDELVKQTNKLGAP